MSESELQRLRDRVEQLEEQFGLATPFPFELKLTKTQEKLLGLLYKRRHVNLESALVVLYGDRVEMPTERMIQVTTCYLRKKLEPWGISIQTHYARGYYLDDLSRARLRRLVEYAETYPGRSRQTVAA